MKRVLKWIGIALLVLMVLPLAVVIAINAFDEKLDPKAAAYGEPRAPSVPEAENGYYAQVALNADDGADGMAFAKASVAEARAAANENRPGKLPQSKRANRPSLCDPAEAPCLTVVRAKPDEAKTKLDAYKEDIERYEKLLAYRRYEEVRDFPERMVLHSDANYVTGRAQIAQLLRAALAIEAGNLDEALNVLERDLTFQRARIEGARTLIGKMIASVMYTRDLAFVADLLRGRSAELVPHVPRLREMLKPLSAAALDMSPALESEFAFSKAIWRDPAANWHDEDSLENRLIRTRLFYNPNATINRVYPYHIAAAKALESPAHRVAADFSALQASAGRMSLWNYIYNPVGNFLARDSAHYVDFALRLHDVDGYNRLIGLWVEMTGAGVGADGAADFVAKSEPRFHDPYTGKPMTWNASVKQLSFQAQGKQYGRKQVMDEKGRIYVQM